jgi:hypothetical protein
MAFNITATMEAIQSLAKKRTEFADVLIGEPKAPPVADDQGLFASIYMESVEVSQTTLSGTIELHVVTLRIYRKLLDEAVAEAEWGIAKVVQALVGDMLADFDLGATIRNVDVGGASGIPLGTRWGQVTIGSTMYRVADIRIPLIVDDSATFTA